MSFQFSSKAEKELESVVKRYPKKDAALLPALWLAQEEAGYLTQDILKYVAGRLGVSLARVESVVSFYTLYKTKPTGKFHIQICRNISCSLRGYDKIVSTLEEELGVQPRQVTVDGNFSFENVECLAACGGAPALQVNGEYHENMTPEKMKALLEELKRNGKNRN